MSLAPDQEHRRRRLIDLLQQFGSKAELGRSLGYKDGAFVWQMINDHRSITETTVTAIETMRGGVFRGWFARVPETPPAEAQAPLAGSTAAATVDGQQPLEGSVPAREPEPAGPESLAPSWPFKTVLHAEIARLTPTRIARLEASMRLWLDAWNEDSGYDAPRGADEPDQCRQASARPGATRETT